VSGSGAVGWRQVGVGWREVSVGGRKVDGSWGGQVLLVGMAVLFVMVVVVVVLAFFRHMRGQAGGRGQANGGTRRRRRQGSRAGQGAGDLGGIVCRGLVPPETTKDTCCWHRGGNRPVQLSLASAPPRLIQGGGIFLLACLSLVAHRTAEAETEGCSRGAGNRRLEQGYVMYVSHAPGRL
jgi:hypothetical protein